MLLHLCLKLQHQQNTTTGSLFLLDPRYVMELKDIKTVYQSENVDTKTLFQLIMPKLYEYIMDAELAVKPKHPKDTSGQQPRVPILQSAASPCLALKLT